MHQVKLSGELPSVHGVLRTAPMQLNIQQLVLDVIRRHQEAKLLILWLQVDREAVVVHFPCLEIDVRVAVARLSADHERPERSAVDGARRLDVDRGLSRAVAVREPVAPLVRQDDVDIIVHIAVAPSGRGGRFGRRSGCGRKGHRCHVARIVLARAIPPQAKVQRGQVLAPDQAVPVAVGREERVLLDKVHVDRVAEHARVEHALDARELFARESQLLVVGLVVESIAELQVLELLGDYAF